MSERKLYVELDSRIKPMMSIHLNILKRVVYTDDYDKLDLDYLKSYNAIVKSIYDKYNYIIDLS